MGTNANINKQRKIIASYLCGTSTREQVVELECVQKILKMADYLYGEAVFAYNAYFILRKLSECEQFCEKGMGLSPYLHHMLRKTNMDSIVLILTKAYKYRKYRSEEYSIDLMMETCREYNNLKNILSAKEKAVFASAADFDKMLQAIRQAVYQSFWRKHDNLMLTDTAALHAEWVRYWAASYDIKDARNSIEMDGNYIGNGGDATKIGGDSIGNTEDSIRNGGNAIWIGGNIIEMEGNSIENGGDSIRIEWNSIEMGGIRVKCGGDFIGIAKGSIKSAENSIRMGLRCFWLARLRAVLSVWRGHLLGSVLYRFIWGNWCVFIGRITCCES